MYNRDSRIIPSFRILSTSLLADGSSRSRGTIRLLALSIRAFRASIGSTGNIARSGPTSGSLTRVTLLDALETSTGERFDGKGRKYRFGSGSCWDLSTGELGCFLSAEVVKEWGSLLCELLFD